MSTVGWKPITCIACGRGFMKAAALQAHQAEEHGAPDAKAAMHKEQYEKALRNFVGRLTEMAHETGFAFEQGQINGPAGSNIQVLIRWHDAHGYMVEQVE